MSEARPIFRDIPAIDALLRAPEVQVLIAEWGRLAVRTAARDLQTHQRRQLRNGVAVPLGIDDFAQALRDRLMRRGGRGPRSVFNLTGTTVHTNLGRSELPTVAVEALARAAGSAVDLEYDLTTGGRGQRDAHVVPLLRDLTGAEAATVVNNNAAALLLILNTLALDREVPVSRGELIEIGGSFRLPDIMSRAGCRLVEVGTTNRTHLKDYAWNIREETGLILKVHRSNFTVEGFTAEVTEEDLAALAREKGLPFVVDLGSGALVDLTRYGLPAEPTPGATLARGADLVCFSGDKMLGGPQAGIIVGRETIISKLNRNPLKRALRLDKTALAALSEVLKLYTEPERLEEELPVLRHLLRTPDDILAQAKRLSAQIRKQLPDYAVEVTPMSGEFGSGALPQQSIASWGVCIQAVDDVEKDQRLDQLITAFRQLHRPVIGRLREHKLWLDFRCLDDEQEFLAQLTALHLSES